MTASSGSAHSRTVGPPIALSTIMMRGEAVIITRAASSSVLAQSVNVNTPEPARQDLSPSITMGWVSHTPIPKAGELSVSDWLSPVHNLFAPQEVLFGQPRGL